MATVIGLGSQWNNSSDLYVGESGNGTLIVAATGVVTNSRGMIALNPGSAGQAIVTGAGSKWINSAGLYLGTDGFGDGGVGTLTVSDAGRVQAGNDSFTLGTGVPEMVMSDSGENGNLVVSHGSTINGVTTSVIGGTAGYTGTATVSGAGSQWNHSSGSTMYVGRYGNGTLNVQAGGLVFNTTGVVAANHDSVSMAEVNGAGSQWTMTGESYVGLGGDGSLIVDTGGVVSNTNGYLGYLAGSSGTASVAGAGSYWNNNGNLDVGSSGLGLLFVQAGGRVSNFQGSIGFSPGSSGNATVSGTGSQWNNSNALVVGLGGNGTLNVQNKGTVTNALGVVGGNAGSTGVATVSGGIAME